MCCGKRRNRDFQELPDNTARQNPVNETNEVSIGIEFKYIGETGLTVTGTITGKRYHFSKPGEVQLIDYRDAGFISSISVLERVNET